MTVIRAQPMDFLLPFISLMPRALAGMRINNGATVQSEGYLAESWTIEGAPAPGCTTTALPLPFLTFDGVDDALAIPDAAPYKLTGALTLLAVVKMASAANVQAIIAKQQTGGDLQYYLNANGGNARFDIEASGGGGSFGVTNGALSTTNYAFVAGRYIPSTEIAVWNSRIAVAKVVNTTSIPASLNNGTASLTIGRIADAGGAGANYLTADVLLAGIYPYGMPDEVVTYLMNHCRRFGVA